MSTPRVEDVWPLSPMQEGMAFLSLMDERGPDVYATQRALDLSGPLDAGRLRASWQALLDRHAALRACFRDVAGGEPVQVIAGNVELPWREEDVSGEADPDAAAWLLAERDQERRFDLGVAPLLRLLLVRLGPGRHRLVLTVHHILLDGWSMQVLDEELWRAYAAGGKAAGLP